MDIKNKTICITGGSTGIGKAIAEACIKKGAQIIILGMHKPEYYCTFFKTDIRNETAIAHAMGKIRRIDVLVANAGIAYLALLEKTTTKQFNELFDTNVRGVFWACKYAIPRLKQKGSIITISSIAGMQSYEHFGAYCATKAAVISMTKTLALELADRKIRVNSIAPGIVETELWKKMHLTMPLLKEYINATLVKRAAQPEEIADATLFLIQNEFVNGSVLTIDGGELVG